jgi:hypothetical protein
VPILAAPGVSGGGVESSESAEVVGKNGVAVRVRVWAWWCAVFLSGGLLGLVVGAASRLTGRTASGASLQPGEACGPCRLRRGLVGAVTGALALMVLVGTGMWVHQQVVTPSPRSCAPMLVSDSWGPSAQSAASVTPQSQAWRNARTALTAPVTGIAYHYANSSGGGVCSTRSVNVAFVPSAGSDTAMTVGDVFLTGLSAPKARDIARHESAHVDQWAVLTLAGGPLALPVAYSLDDTIFPGSRNHFERAAGLRAGDYVPPYESGPNPMWGRLSAIMLLVLLVFWRRLRWASRTALLGAAGARYTEPGRCRVHSRGWCRIGT